jgi:hypothetical protein
MFLILLVLLLISLFNSNEYKLFAKGLLKILKENNVPFSNLFSLVKKVIFSELLLL